MNNWIKACLAALMCMAMPVLAGTLTFDTYYHNDHLGSPVAATDERSDLLWRAHFRPYGERQENPADTAFGNVGYTGHMQDADSGLVYMQARYYDPLIGRFLAVDPVGISPSSPVSFNRYVYANNNPYRYTDPDGQIPLDYLVDGLSIAASSAIYARDPSVSNGIALAADVVLAGLPYVPAGIGLIRGGDKLLDADKAIDGAGEAAKNIDPKSLIGRQGKDEMSGSQVKRLTKDMKENGYDPSHPVDVANVDGKLIILDGHHRAQAAAKAGIKDIPVNVHNVTREQGNQLIREAAEARARF